MALGRDRKLPRLGISNNLPAFGKVAVSSVTDFKLQYFVR